MEGLVGWLIIVLIWVLVSASKGTKKTPPAKPGTPGARPAGGNQPTAQARQAASQVQASHRLSAEEIRRAAQMILGETPAAKPAAPAAARTAAPAEAAHDHGFYQGSSFGDEGKDPCHDDMYGAHDEPVADHGFYQGASFGNEGIDPCHGDLYQAREPLAAAGTQPAQAGFNLKFTRDNVLNGVIMSEILARRE